MRKTERLTVQNLVTTGIFAMLLFLCMFAVIILLGMNPFTYLAAPCVLGLVSGLPILLLLYKVPKTGTAFLLIAIQAVFLLLMGRLPVDILALFCCAIIAEILYGLLGRGTFRAAAAVNMVYACAIMLVTCVGLLIMKDAYLQAFAAYGDAFLNGINQMVNPVSFMLLMAVAAICGLSGALLARKVLSKHFHSSSAC